MKNNYLKLIDVEKTYAGGYRGLGYVNFAMQKGEVSVFVGGPVCGKSTLLSVISGLEGLSSGSIILDDKDISHLKIVDREIGLITEDLQFFDNKDVLYNLTYPLKIRNVDIKEINAKVDLIVKLSSIKNYLAKIGKNLTRYEKVQCSLARLAMVERKLYLIDNVFEGLNNDEIDVVIKQMKKIFNGKTVVVAVSTVELAKKLNPDNVGFICYNSISDYKCISNLNDMRNTVASVKYLFDNEVVEIPCDINNDGTLTIFNNIIDFDKKIVSDVFLDGILVVPLSDVVFNDSSKFSGKIVKIDGEYLTLKVDEDEYKLVSNADESHNIGDVVRFEFDVNKYDLYDFGSERKITT